MAFRFERWFLQLRSIPRIRYYCPQCKRTNSFVCGERFRVNAQKKVLDVWLLYRCFTCELTWKLPVLARRNIASIDPALLERFEHNDALTARRLGSDATVLNGYAIDIDASDIEVTRVAEDRAARDGDRIRLSIEGPCDIRLDRLIARELGLTRAALNAAHSAQRVIVMPSSADALSRKAQDGQEICFLDGFTNSEDP